MRDAAARLRGSEPRGLRFLGLARCGHGPIVNATCGTEREWGRFKVYDSLQSPWSGGLSKHPLRRRCICL